MLFRSHGLGVLGISNVGGPCGLLSPREEERIRATGQILLAVERHAFLLFGFCAPGMLPLSPKSMYFSQGLLSPAGNTASSNRSESSWVAVLETRARAFVFGNVYVSRAVTLYSSYCWEDTKMGLNSGFGIIPSTTNTILFVRLLMISKYGLTRRTYEKVVILPRCAHLVGFSQIQQQLLARLRVWRAGR